MRARQIVGLRHSDPIQRNNLDGSERRIRNALAAQEVLQLKLLLPQIGLGIHQVVLRGRELRFSSGNIQASQGSCPFLEPAVLVEFLRDFDGVGFCLDIFVSGRQRIVKVEHLVDGIAHLGLEIQRGSLYIQLAYSNSAGVDGDSEATQEVLLERDRETGCGGRIQNVGGRVLVQITVPVTDRNVAADQESLRDK